MHTYVSLVLLPAAHLNDRLEQTFSDAHTVRDAQHPQHLPDSLSPSIQTEFTLIL